MIIVLFQALQKAGKTGEERVEDYVLVEDVQRGWDKNDVDKPGQQRILELNEKLMQAQNRWKGAGKFVLRKKGDVSHIIMNFWGDIICIFLSDISMYLPEWYYLPLEGPSVKPKSFPSHDLGVGGSCTLVPSSMG